MSRRPGNSIDAREAEAARRLGKGQSYIWKSEVGERRVDVIEAKEFAKLYGVSITYFYE